MYICSLLYLVVAQLRNERYLGVLAKYFIANASNNVQ